MDLNPAMGYRITTLEIEQAAIRAERARMVAEHSEQIVRRDGLVRRMLRRVAGRWSAEAVSGDAVAEVPTTAPVAPASAASAPVPVRVPQPAADQPAADDARADELIGCSPRAA